jgi:phenylacetic acid degradation operon negative regulatory protein
VLHRYETDLLDDKACFAIRLRCAVDFVAITLEDPLLPPVLLPKDWPRPAAQRIHKQLQRSLAEPYKRFFEAIYQTGEGG